jgi:hypothetical protein
MGVRLRSGNPDNKTRGYAKVRHTLDGMQPVREGKEIDYLMVGYFVVFLAIATEPVECSSKLALVEAYQPTIIDGCES